MKYIILHAACFLGTQTFAQELKLDMDKVKKFLDQNKASQDFSPSKLQKQLSPLLIKKSMFDTVRFSHTTAQGDVFILPQDNMPCLKPNSNIYVNNMPNASNNLALNTRTGLANTIPNGFKGKPFLLNAPNSKPLEVTEK